MVSYGVSYIDGVSKARSECKYMQTDLAIHSPQKSMVVNGRIRVKK